MQFLYNIAVNAAEKLLPVSGLFSNKMKQFVHGRKKVFDHLAENISPGDKVIWIHAASLGEYEQAVPVIEEIRKILPGRKILMTFFSPSGYEVKKKNSIADVTTYLPLDTAANASKFLDLVHLEWALFIKYEFWPNYLKELRKRKIRTLLVSGSFREDQLFFKNYGKWLRRYLHTFEHFFVQNERSAELLSTLKFTNISISGDTRFDRVSRQIEQDNSLEFINRFKDGKLCVVCGSTWPEDEEMLVDFINQSDKAIKFIIAPHALKPAKVKQLQDGLQVKSVRYTQMAEKNLEDFNVFIIDTIGLLTRIYSYADIAYVGGAAGNTGLHNVLEPATFGVPIIIGKNFSRFPEAIQLQQLAGLFAVGHKRELADILEKLINDRHFRKKTGMISGHFINSNTGATRIITDYLKERNSESKRAVF